MKAYCRQSVYRFVILLLLLTAGRSPGLKAQDPPASGAFLSASDFHFNPFFDPSLVDTLVRTDYTGWAGIFESSAITTPNSYGSDPNYPLFKSALMAMQQQNPQPAFILISGDFLCHDFQSNFGYYAPNYPDSLRSFIAKTINFMAWMLDHYFPKTIVLPVLGNNDSYCGDYEVQPNSPFLAMFARAWAPLQRNNDAVADSNFVQQFSIGGYYTYPLNYGIRAQLVLLNTVFFSAKYVNSCGNAADNPAADEMKWLDSLLQQSNTQRRAAWMVYHIAPSIDVYATLRGHGTCASNITLMWDQGYNSQFLSLVTRYPSVVRAAFAGHTHMDDFKVIYNRTLPVSFIHLTPAVSPLFANNPGFQQITFDTATLRLLNAATFYLNLGKGATAWIPEYNFRKTYGVNGINAASLSQVRRKIVTDTTFRNKYINLYNVSNPSGNGVNQTNWKAYWCGTGALTQQDFAKCYCTLTPTKPPQQ